MLHFILPLTFVTLCFSHPGKGMQTYLSEEGKERQEEPQTHKHILFFIELVLCAEATLQCLLQETHTE